MLFLFSYVVSWRLNFLPVFFDYVVSYLYLFSNFTVIPKELFTSTNAIMNSMKILSSYFSFVDLVPALFFTPGVTETNSGKRGGILIALRHILRYLYNSKKVLKHVCHSAQLVLHTPTKCFFFRSCSHVLDK